VRERGEIQQWLQFFLTAVRRQADDGVERARRLVKLREEYLADASRSRSRIGELVALVFTNPFVNVRRVESKLGLTNQGARRLIQEAEQRGWLSDIGLGGRGGRRNWIATRVFEIIESPATYRADGPARSRP
jgi:Fic family protein